MRTLTPQEQDVLFQFGASMPEEQRRRFLHDLENCRVAEQGVNGSRLIFELTGYSRPSYRGQHAYPVEGTVLDYDGTDVSVYVYADENDRLLELEFVKWADSPFTALKWETFRIV
jgi:hypothetical protein